MNQASLSPWAPCPKCGNVLCVDVTLIIAYLNGHSETCSTCGEVFEWWSIASKSIEENFLGNQALFFIGARTNFFKLLLKPGISTVFRFSDYGIPADAKILYVNYTPSGPLFPIEVHGNVSTQRFRTDEVVLYPRPIPSMEVRETEVNVIATWVAPGSTDESWKNLVEAFEAFITGQYSSMVVPANVAVESMLLRLMTAYFDRFVSKKATEEFLSNGATYSSQLNVLLPTFAALSDLPGLPHKVLINLNRLRKLRNRLAHRGEAAPTTKKDAAEMLCGALFGFHYMRHVGITLGLGDY